LRKKPSGKLECARKQSSPRGGSSVLLIRNYDLRTENLEFNQGEKEEFQPGERRNPTTLLVGGKKGYWSYLFGKLGGYHD